MRKNFRSAVSLVLVLVMLLSCSVSAFANTGKSVLDRDPEEIKADAIDVMTDLLDSYIVKNPDVDSEQIKDDAINVMTKLWNDYISQYVNPGRELPDGVIADVEVLMDAIVASYSEGSSAELKACINALKVKYAEDLYDATHGEYAPAKDDVYVAIGGADVGGLGLIYDKGDNYYKQVADELGIASSDVAIKGALSSSAALELIEKNAEIIETASLITYQPDASAFILATETADWGKYFGDREVVLMELMKDVVAKIDTEDVSFIASDIKDEVLAQLPADLVADVEDETVDALLELCVAMVEAAVDMAGFDVLAAYEKINTLTKNMAENVIFSMYSYVVDTVRVLERLQKINPDATILVLGLYNSYEGLSVVRNGAEIDLDQYMNYFFDLTNLYNTAYAVADGNVAFVDITGTSIAGLENPAINADDLNYDKLVSIFTEGTFDMHANAAGHAYIAEQILAALEIKKPEFELPEVVKPEGGDGDDTTDTPTQNAPQAAIDMDSAKVSDDGKSVSFKLDIKTEIQNAETGKTEKVQTGLTYLVWIVDKNHSSGDGGYLAEVTGEGKDAEYTVPMGAQLNIFVLGDTDSDGKVGAADASKALKSIASHLANNTESKGLEKAIGNFDGNDDFGAADVSTLLQFVAKSLAGKV